MEEQDVRWEQRFSNFKRAFSRMNEIADHVTESYDHANLPSDRKSLGVRFSLYRDGVIHCFENTHELAWKTMRDFAHYQGNYRVNDPREATKEAFSMEIIPDGEAWMDMLESRQKTLLCYEDRIASSLFKKITEQYHPAFLEFKNTMEEKRGNDSGASED